MSKRIFRDANGDGVFTISDVWIYIKYGACFPGNFIVNFVGSTEFGRFLEIDGNMEYTWLAWLISAAIWLPLCVFLSNNQRT